ncbi:MAG: hypothetical protein HFG27_00425 [Provencibacterium sp.]|nr:hypothetical protein [Provencibacterium sp.]
MDDLYQFPDIYEERFTERANQIYKSHYENYFLAGKFVRYWTAALAPAA